MAIKLSLHSKELEKYLIHVSSARFRDKIQKEGLKANSNDSIGYRNMVFAHNSDVITPNWYPIIYDAYIFEVNYSHCFRNDKDAFMYYLSMLDFWKIDTGSLRREWFVDTLAEKECCFYGKNKKNLFVKCNGDIPPEHIRRIKPEDLKMKFYDTIELISLPQVEVKLMEEPQRINDLEFSYDFQFIGHGKTKKLEKYF